MNIPPEQCILNPEQKKAVEFGEGPLLIIAGAGTGKTTVVTERIKYLIASGRAKPQEILALTFTEKASQEMEARVDIALPYGVTQMWISTFHAFCDRVLRTEAINIGIDPGYKLMTEAETIMFFRKHLFEFDLKEYRPLGNPTKFIAGMIQHFSRLKDEDITPHEYLKYDKNELSRVFQKYEELKVKESVADYADLISWTLKLFRDRAKILARYQKQFRYILIDEFQDTNYAQNELAVLLAGSKNNITVVGDDDQAIYRWRGAAISNIIQFRKTFPKVKIVVLTKNYRSTKEILDRSYDLIQNNNPDRLEMAEKIDKKLESMRRINGTPVEVFYTERVEHESEMVVKKIKELSQYEYKNFAILVRANNHAEPFVRALSRAGIPYQFLGPGQLFRQPEVKDLIAYLKVLYNFEDNVAMYRVLTMDIFGISPREVAVLVNMSRKFGISLFEACEKSHQKIAEIIQKHLGFIKKETAGQILYYFLEETGLLKKLATYKTPKDERVAENIAKFFNKLKTYEMDHEDAGVFAVVDWLELSMNLGESPLATDTDWSENNAVNILTIHSAKGLEFPVVFLVNLVSARFPTNERKEQLPIPDAFVKEILPKGDYHEEEERRLFYVGMTRARDHLYFTGAKYYGEGKREKRLSSFIQEALGKEPSFAHASEGKQLSFLDWKKTETPIPKPNRVVSYLSYSQLSTFSTCPLQYKYRYIVKIPVPPRAALVFGDTIHKVMHDFYLLKRPVKEDLLRLLEKHWSSAGYGDRVYEEKMKRQGRELLEGFYNKGYDPNVIPIALEEPFKIKLSPTLTLGGKIDRIDKTKNGIEIIDYKTGTAPKSRDISKDLQLTVYAMAEESKNVIVSFYFFDGQQKISAIRTKEQIKEAKKEIITIADEISHSDFQPTPGKWCDFCEFRLICEAWN